MCGRARCVLSDETISTCSKVSKSEFKNSKAYEPMENMTPGKFFPVLYKDPSSGKRCLQFMVWGLIPSHTNAATSDRLDFFKMFNARLETIDEKQSYRKIVKTNRCAVLLSGYFEWKIAKDTGRKQPYYICRKDGNPLCLAAIYDVFKGKGEIYTFSIVTADSSLSSEKKLRDLHDRQPVFLTSDCVIDKWVNSESLDDSSLLLDISLAPDDLVSYPVTPLMSHASYQHADCANQVASPMKSRVMTDFFSKSPQKNLADSNIPASTSPKVEKSNNSYSNKKRKNIDEKGCITRYFKEGKKDRSGKSDDSFLIPSRLFNHDIPCPDEEKQVDRAIKASLKDK